MRPKTQNRFSASGKKRGFTLIELMVTVALLIIMLYMVAMIFSAAQRSFHDSRAAVEAHQTARAIFDMMRDEISAALLIRHGDGSMMLFEGVDAADWAGDSRPDLEKGDALRFTTTAYQASRSRVGEVAPGVPRIVEVKYFKHNDELVKIVNWDDGFAARTDWTTDFGDGDPAEGIGFNINNITIRYLDKRAGTSLRPRVLWTGDGNWQIGKGRLPAAVEVILEIKMVDSTGRDFNETLSEIIYLPNSELQG